MTLVAALAGCGSGKQRAFDQHMLDELNRLEAGISGAHTSEQERAAFSELNRTCQDGRYSYVLTLYDAAGAEIPIDDWSKDRSRLSGAQVELEIKSPDPRLTRKFKHRLIDPENFAYLLMER
jgi:hypothetical protein